MTLEEALVVLLAAVAGTFLFLGLAQALEGRPPRPARRHPVANARDGGVGAPTVTEPDPAMREGAVPDDAAGREHGATPGPTWEPLTPEPASIEEPRGRMVVEEPAAVEAPCAGTVSLERAGDGALPEQPEIMDSPAGPSFSEPVIPASEGTETPGWSESGNLDAALDALLHEIGMTEIDPRRLARARDALVRTLEAIGMQKAERIARLLSQGDRAAAAGEVQRLLSLIRRAQEGGVSKRRLAPVSTRARELATRLEPWEGP